MSDEPQEIIDARAELDAAVRKWLKIKAFHEDNGEYDAGDNDLMRTDDPIVLGWVAVAVYTSMDLEQADATATLYECPEGQPAPFSRGIALAAVDRWANR